MNLKTFICAASGAVGGVMAQFFGGWNSALTTLLIFMGMDYLTGIIVAAIFHNSEKSETGGLNSRVGQLGLIRKGITLLIVAAAYRMDLLIGTTYIKDAVIIAFCVNELISLTENAGLMGIPIPDAIKRGIEVLRKGDDDDENGSDK